MNRRTFIVGCSLSLVVPGCLDAPRARENETSQRRGATDTGEIQQAYVIHLERSEDDIADTEDVCEFADLPEAAQREFEQALDDGEYRVEETPELMQRNCHNGYVEYESTYYWLRITIETG